jgi:predicted small lipoprotein YifL
MHFFLLPVLTGLLLAGCGQKDALYIPKDDAKPVPSSIINE